MTTSVADKSWYEDGLAFECRGCGRCCRGPGGYVWVSSADIERLAGALKMDLDAFGKKFLRRSGGRLALVDGAGGDCAFLEAKGRCAVYEARPEQCRTYPWWPEVVRGPESWKGERRHCPGIDSGPIVPAETIRAEVARSETTDIH